MVVDLYGDFGDELVHLTTEKDRKKSITVVTATIPIQKNISLQPRIYFAVFG